MAKEIKLKELFSQSRIKRRVQKVAHCINSDYKNKAPILIGILNGSFIFFADLIRELEIDCEVDFMKVSSYKRHKSEGLVSLVSNLSSNIKGRDVIIVEDIIDSGLTINYLINLINESDPSSIAVATLLFKKEVAQLNFTPEYVCFEIPQDYVVGYGLDYDQKMRNLKSIKILDKLDIIK